MRAISEVSTSTCSTPGETPFAVVISPNTTHGWRPISVKIQPKELARAAGTAARCAAPQDQRPRGRPAAPGRPAGASAAIAAASRPRPIISRKDQYVTGMFGT